MMSALQSASIAKRYLGHQRLVDTILIWAPDNSGVSDDKGINEHMKADAPPCLMLLSSEKALSRCITTDRTPFRSQMAMAYENACRREGLKAISNRIGTLTLRARCTWW